MFDRRVRLRGDDVPRSLPVLPLQAAGTRLLYAMRGATVSDGHESGLQTFRVHRGELSSPKTNY